MRRLPVPARTVPAAAVALGVSALLLLTSCASASTPPAASTGTTASPAAVDTASSVAGRTGATSTAPTPGTSPGSVPARMRIDQAELAALAEELRAETDSPGAIVAVVGPDGTATTAAAGLRDTRSGEALRVDDPINTASVTKAFTAAVVLALVADGTLALDDHLDTLLPGGWPDGDRITVRMLLDHTAGVGGFGNRDDETTDYDRLVIDAGHRYSTAELLPVLRGLPATAPGPTRYTNTAYIVLGAVAEARTGRSMDQLYRDLVLDPAGLDHTRYAPEGPTVPFVDGILRGDTGGEAHAADSPADARLTLGGPSAGMVSTVPDLLAWTPSWLEGTVPNPALGAEAIRIHPGGTGLGINGVLADGTACVYRGCPDDAAYPRRGLGGNAIGVSLRIVHDPRTGITVLAFANTTQAPLDPWTTRLLAAATA